MILISISYSKFLKELKSNNSLSSNVIVIASSSEGISNNIRRISNTMQLLSTIKTDYNKTLVIPYFHTIHDNEEDKYCLNEYIDGIGICLNRDVMVKSRHLRLEKCYFTADKVSDIREWMLKKDTWNLPYRNHTITTLSKQNKIFKTYFKSLF